METLDIIGGVCDNWYYFGRVSDIHCLLILLFVQIKTIPFKNDTWEQIINRGSTMPTILIYTIQIISEFINCRRKAKKEKLRLRDVLWQKKWFWIMKFSEYPM